MRHFAFGLILASLAVMLAAPVFAADTDSIIGFTPASAARQHQLEKQFDAALNKDDIRHWIKTMSSKPNQIGAPHNKANAERMLELFKSWGFDAEIKTYKVLFPTPKVRELELVAPHHYEATLREPPIKGDSTSDIYKHALPPYNAYSADGDVTAELVYVNYGLPEDYDELARRGISVKGKIVIARYGHSWRGIKPKLAYQHGAIACIIYSDPADDGYRRGDAYPDGGWRDRWGVQRGSVANMTLYSGDPLTPGYASVPGAKRLSRDEASAIKKIPVLPIAYADALPLLRALGGDAVPGDWQGALPMTYHFGPGPAKVHLKLAFNWEQVPAYDVIAKIPGSEYPDQWVMRGNHHDAWVFGADDPLSGNAAMLAEAKALGALLKTGWQPKRTIVYMSWDGEEPGLLGSTEWAEDHAEQLSDGGVIYINSDSNGRGFLYAGGSGSLQRFIDEVGRGVDDPETDASVIHRARAHRLVNQLKHPPQNPADKISANANEPLPIYALGSGSDYTAFLDHFGVASLNIGFGGEGEGTQYHSRYDSFDWYRRFADPTFEYGVALAKVGGHAVLRFANADILPYTFTGFANHIADYAHEIEKLHDHMQEKTQNRNALIKQNAFTLSADPTEQYMAPQPKPAVPALGFKPLDEAVARLKAAAADYDAALRARGDKLPDQARARLNELLIATERQLLDKEGLPRRAWYRHMIYAPGYYTGYGVKTMPGIREAVEQRDWDQAEKYIGIVAGVLNDFSGKVEQATALLKDKATYNQSS
ncbi:MAG TPA: transferrin receptor-like dimerization domain-containing protein [Gammaproteobacteria bacterium]|nr:transferrin receptor-like dimerization domain-containing protein [Gammaproteobacteria bacterium]